MNDSRIDDLVRDSIGGVVGNMKFEVRHCDFCGAWRPAWKSIHGKLACKKCSVEAAE